MMTGDTPILGNNHISPPFFFVVKDGLVLRIETSDDLEYDLGAARFKTPQSNGI